MIDKINKRNYGLELLKVIAIIMVIVLHYNNGFMGGILDNISRESMNYGTAVISEALAIISCNLFVMISGYYLCKDDKIKIRKIFDIILLLIFYGIIIYLWALFSNGITFSYESIKILLKTIDARWFVNVYLLLYIIHPFINKIIKNISQNNFKLLLVISIIFVSLWSSCTFDIIDRTQFVSDSGSGITNFILLYLIASYIRMYKDDLKINKYILLGIYIILSIITGLAAYKYHMVYDYNFILNIISTICVFLIFKNMKITKGNIIQKLASTSLAVYIIYENALLRVDLFQNLFRTVDYYNSSYLILHMIVTVTIIFIVCSLIEIVRVLIFNKTINKWLDKSKTINKVIEIN